MRFFSLKDSAVLIAFLFSFFISNHIFSSEIDSLRNLIPLSSSEFEKVQLLNKKSKIYWESDPELAIRLTSEALNISKWNDYKSEIIDSYNVLGACYFSVGNYSKALENYFWALRYAEKTSDVYFAARAYRNIAFVYKMLKMPKESIQFSNLSLQFLDKKNDNELRSDCYYYLASSHGLMGKYQEEIKYLHKAVDLRIRNKQWREVGIEYNSLGQANFKLQNFEDALNYFHLYLKYSVQFKDSAGTAIAYNNIAESLENQGKYLDAIKAYNKAIDLNQSNILYSYTGLVRSYCKINRTDKAVHYFDKAYKAQADLNELAQSSKILAAQFRKNKDFNTALAYNDIFISLNDKIITLSKKEVELLKPQYDVEGIQERIAQAEVNELLKENYALQSKQNRLLIIIVVLAIVASICSVYILRKRMMAKASKLKFVEKNVLEMGKYLKDMREIISQR